MSDRLLATRLSPCLRYSSGMVMAIPPITSLSLKSRFGLSR
jgi:hypothetical protein